MEDESIVIRFLENLDDELKRKYITIEVTGVDHDDPYEWDIYSSIMWNKNDSILQSITTLINELLERKGVPIVVTIEDILKAKEDGDE